MLKKHYLLPALSVLVFFFGIASFSQADTTDTQVESTNVAPSFDVVTNDSSDATTPTNFGSAVTFTGTATDTNADNYYLIVCAAGNTVTANSEAAPSCSGTQICVSSSTASGAQATCTSAATSETIPTQTTGWTSFVCDHHTSSLCSSAENTNSPYHINHRPSFASVTEDDAAGAGSTIEPGDTVYVSAVVTDNDDNTTQDTVTMVVCSDGSTFNGTGDPCNGGTQYCTDTDTPTGSSPNIQATLECALPSSLTTIPTAHGSYSYEIFVYDVHEFQASESSDHSYAVEDVAPVVDAVTIHGNNQPFTGSAAPGDTPSGSPSATFTLTAATTTTFYWIAAIHDDNGDGDLASSITGRIYDTGASQTSTCDANTGTNANAQQECYQATQASTCEFRAQSTVGSGKTATGTDQNAYVSCSTPVYFNANASSLWAAMVEIADGTTTGVDGTTSSSDYEVAALTAIDIRDGSDVTGATVNYGALSPGQDTDTTNQSVYVANVGNQPFDTNLYGSDMCDSWNTAYSDCGGNSISVNQQKYATASFTYSSGGTALELQASLACVDNTVPVREINTDASGSDPIYFGVGLPTGTPSGNYTGQNTFAATSSC